MKRTMYVLLGVVFSFMVCLTCMGYAQVADDLTLEGEANYTPPNAIYIIDVKDVQTSDATVQTSPVNIGYPTTKVLSQATFSQRNATMTYVVTVVNNSQVDQIFDKMTSHASDDEVVGVFNYTGITCTASPGQGTVVRSGQTMDFTITCKYTGSSTNQSRNMLYSLSFVMDSDDLTQIVSKSVTGQFALILNNEMEEDVTYTLDGKEYVIPKDETYKIIDENMEGSTPGFFSTGRYMGNLEGADDDDKAILTAMFGEDLTFHIGDKEVPVTIMMKEKNVYGSGDYEMVLYITADDLADRSTYVPVYAVVFSKDADGYWQQIGDIFAGQARTNDYSGWTGSGSFDTESWRSTAVYYDRVTGTSINDLMTAYTQQNP